MNNKLLHTLSMLLLAMVAFTFTSCSDEDEMGEAAGIVGKWRDGNKTLLFEKNGNFSSEIETTPVQQCTGTYSYNPTLGNLVINISESSREVYNVLTLNATILVLLYTNGDVEGFYTRVTGEKIDVPSVTTADVTNVSPRTATIGGEVTSDGGLVVTERGVVYSTSPKPTTADTKLVSGKGKGLFSAKLTNLKETTTYYVRAYAVNSKGTSYGEQKSFTTKNSSDPAYYVDLGLSVKWATCNVGADSPEDYGDYFAWGETQPKSTYNWSTYKWSEGDSDNLTKYCTISSYGTVDYKTQLDLSDDAACANWGGSWRMPTYEEFTELREKCSCTWTTQNGVKGYKVTSKTNGNSIFLPAAGYRDDSSLSEAGSYGYYWSSSLGTDSPDYARYVYFSSSSVDWNDNYRYYGQSVRPVCP